MTIEQSYNPAYFAQINKIEEEHFWFRHRRGLITRWVQKIVKTFEPGYRLLEVGCGNGHVLKALDKACSQGQVMGMELHQQGIDIASNNTACQILQGDITQAPSHGDAFHLIGLFDVLEHLVDDEQVLGNIFTMLKENGYVFLTVPANPKLWSYFDEASKHQRRYLKAELVNKLEKTGFTVVYVSYYMLPTYPLIWLSRKLKQMFNGQSNDVKASDDLKITPILNTVLYGLLTLEAPLVLQAIPLPFGSSLLAIACKKT